MSVLGNQVPKYADSLDSNHRFSFRAIPARLQKTLYSFNIPLISCPLYPPPHSAESTCLLYWWNLNPINLLPLCSEIKCRITWPLCPANTTLQALGGLPCWENHASYFLGHNSLAIIHIQYWNNYPFSLHGYGYFGPLEPHLVPANRPQRQFSESGLLHSMAWSVRSSFHVGRCCLSSISAYFDALI